MSLLERVISDMPNKHLINVKYDVIFDIADAL